LDYQKLFRLHNRDVLRIVAPPLEFGHCGNTMTQPHAHIHKHEEVAAEKLGDFLGPAGQKKRRDTDFFPKSFPSQAVDLIWRHRD
jgi:hypothetical protein